MDRYWNSKYGKEVVLLIFITATPFLIYTHLLFSDELTVISLFGYTITHAYENNQVYIWALLNSLVPFLLFLVCFFTSSQKWKYAFLPLIFFPAENLARHFKILKPYWSNKTWFLESILICSFLLIIVYLDTHFNRKHRRKELQVSLRHIMTSTPKNIYEAIFLRENPVSKNTSSQLRALYAPKMFISKYVKSLNIRRTRRNKLLLDIVCIIVLLLTSILPYLQSMIPDDIMQVDLDFIVLDNNGFRSFGLFIWFLSIKLSVLMPVGIWFILSKSWWRYGLLSTLFIYAYQFWEAFQDEKYLDAYGNTKIIPLILFLFLLMVILSKHVKYHSKILDLELLLNQAIESKLSNLFENGDGAEFAKRRYAELKQLGNTLPANAYIDELSQLKQDLEHMARNSD